MCRKKDAMHFFFHSYSDKPSLLDLEIPPRSQITDDGNKISSMNKEPAVIAQRQDKESEHAIPAGNTANTSRHDQSMILEDEDDVNNDAYDVTKFRAAVPFSDVIKNGETKKQLINRLENFLLERFDSVVRVTITKSGDPPLAVAIMTAPNQHKELVNSVFALLKTNESADTPIFHAFDPQKIAELERLRTLNVRNIPLRLKKENLATYFKQFGIIDLIRMRVPHNSLFQSAEIVFQDLNVINQFYCSKWGTFIMGECDRIYPAALSKEEHDA